MLRSYDCTPSENIPFTLGREDVISMVRLVKFEVDLIADMYNNWIVCVRKMTLLNVRHISLHPGIKDQ